MPKNLKPGFFINGTFTTDSFGYKMTDRFYSKRKVLYS